MRYLSVCSGIEAATVAWHGLGWTPVGFSEIEAFPSQVLKHHYPDVQNFGDLTKHATWPLELESTELLVGGTPCQSFSVAGLRKGLSDPRGNLALVYLGLLDRLRPRWCVWENVPGVLSSAAGRDFGAFLGALGQLGYGWAYRVLDAQYFGVAQRRRRVFVVGHLGNWRPAAEVLFESSSLRGDPPKSRRKREAVARESQDGAGIQPFEVANCLTARMDKGINSKVNEGQTPILQKTVGAIGFNWQNAGGYGNANEGLGITENGTGPLQRCQTPAVAVSSGRGWWSESDGTAQTLRVQDTITKADTLPIVGMQVRRLTPLECERLQGFPDGYTQIPWRKKPQCPDGPRYKALGNSMAVPVMRWIGRRIEVVQHALNSG